MNQYDDPLQTYDLTMNDYYDGYDIDAIDVYLQADVSTSSQRLPVLAVDDYYSDPTDEIGKYMRIII